MRPVRNAVRARQEGPVQPASPRGELLDCFAAHRPQLLRLCLRWTRGHSPDAEDLLAAAALRILERTRRSDSVVSAPLAWWATVISNLGRDLRRARVDRDGRSRFIDGLDVVVLESRSSTDAVAAARRELAELASALERLPPRQRRAIALRSTGYDYEEVGATLGISPANARKLVQLARSELRARAAAQSCGAPVRALPIQKHERARATR